MKEEINELAVVALLRDIPEKSLIAGQVGTVIEILDEDVFEVEFSDDLGEAYAILSLKKEDLIHLHYSPVAA